MSFKHRLKTIVLSILTVTFIATGLVPVTHAADEDWVPVVKRTDFECTPEEMEAMSASDTTKSKPTSEESSDGLGDVTKEGTEANKNAQEIFDVLTKDYGTSGAFAIGVLANVKYESGFIPDRAEGPGILRFGMDSKKKPAGAVNSANPSQEPGGGLYQFTPFTKFTDSSEWGKHDKDGWGIKNQTAFVINSEFKGNTVMIYLKDAASNSHRNPEGKQAYKDVVDWAMSSDIERATWAFQSGYERPANFDLSRIQTAKELAKHFDANVRGDEKKIKDKILQGKSSTTDSSDSSASTFDDSEETRDYCSPASSNTKKFDWLEDGTGEHGQNLMGGIMYIHAKNPDELADKYKDIAKYFIDPEALDMTWQKAGHKNGWNEKIGNPARNQCVDLTTALAGNLWWKDGKRSLEMLDSNPHGLGTGNGHDTAFNLGAAYSDKKGQLKLGDKGMSNKPTKGALFSVGGGSYGHTGIVSHVFENGDIAVTEMNITGYSGEGNGTHHDWSFGIISKSRYEKDDFSFFDPSAVGYEPNPKALGKK